MTPISEVSEVSGLSYSITRAPPSRAQAAFVNLNSSSHKWLREQDVLPLTSLTSLIKPEEVEG
jgi:hypothetical protein